MKTISKYFLCLMSFVFLSSAYAKACIPHHDTSVKLLFLQQANSGSILPIKNKAGCYQLVLERLHPHILYFGSAPSRSTGHFTVQQFLVTLEHNQRVDLVVPNGTLNAYSDPLKREINLVGKLSNAFYKNKDFHYNFCLLNDNKTVKEGKLRVINLFIDPVHRWPP